MGSAKTRAVFQGIGVSPGIAIGEVRVADRCRVAVVEVPVAPEEVTSEIGRFHSALETAKAELQSVREQFSQSERHEHLFVIDAHLLILEDSMLVREVVGCIESEGINAEGALRRASQKFRSIFETMEDEYLRGRGDDVETVLERVLRNLAGDSRTLLPPLEGKVILATHDLSPADLLQLDRSKVIGFVTDIGGKTSHTAILARSFEIPAVVGMGDITSRVADGDRIIIDGSAGTVQLNPDQGAFSDYLRRKQEYEFVEQELLLLRELPAETTDGVAVALQGNVEFVEEVAAVRNHGGEGIGLYRTELLFMNRDDLPSEEEQFNAYAAVVREMAPLPVSIRTLDAGGDKVVTELNLQDEINPALGMRAVRLSLRFPGLFKTQLRAILRASAFGTVRVFFPMISGVAEVREAKSSLEEAKAELRLAGVPFDEKIEVGAMIEIPSAVITADILAKEVDFFSVGTNDLIQYSLAVDRTNKHLSYLYEPLHPAILRSLRMIADAAHSAGIRVSMCGEMAGDPHYLPVLLGLGFDELSMSPASIPRVKQVLRRCSRSAAEAAVDRALAFTTASEIECLLQDELPEPLS